MSLDSNDKRKRSANFTSEEHLLLVRLTQDKKNVIQSKCIDTATRKQKEAVWDEITRNFNLFSPSNVKRSAENLKKHYLNMKRWSFNSVDPDCSTTSNGGGQCPANPSCFRNTKMGDITKYLSAAENNKNWYEDRTPQKSIVKRRDSKKHSSTSSKEISDSEDHNCDTTNQTQLNEMDTASPAKKQKLSTENITIRRHLTSPTAYRKYRETKMKIATTQLDMLSREVKHQEEKMKLELEALKLDIEIKKRQLQRLEENSHLFKSI